VISNLPSHVGGAVSINVGSEMQAYDSLPPEVRRALANADNKFTALQMRQLLDRGVPAWRLPKAIEISDREMNEKIASAA
jgi:hypothetical protein